MNHAPVAFAYVFFFFSAPMCLFPLSNASIVTYPPHVLGFLDSTLESLPREDFQSKL